MASVIVPVATSPEYLLLMSSSHMAAVFASVAVRTVLTRQLSVGFPSMTIMMFIVPSISSTVMVSPAVSAWEHVLPSTSTAVAVTVTVRLPSFFEA